MAKQHHPGNDRSKVRILFVEGDFAPGDLHELTEALTNAIKPSTTIVRQLGGARSAASPTLGAAIETDDASGISDTHLGDAPSEEVVAEPARVRTISTKRTYRKPKPVDMDMAAGGTAFADFATQKAPASHRARYLVAASWLHDFAGNAEITIDHVFTCYKAAGWHFDVTDPTLVFRTLKNQGMGAHKSGNFKINHLGLSEVQKMKAPPRE